MNTTPNKKEIIVFFLLIAFVFAAADIYDYFQQKKVMAAGVYTKCTVTGREQVRSGHIITISYTYKGKAMAGHIRSNLGEDAIGQQYFVKVISEGSGDFVFLPEQPVPECFKRLPAPFDGWKSIPFCQNAANTEYADRENNVLSYLKGKGLLYINDTAKWRLYNIYCDDTVPNAYIHDTSKVFFSFLDLKPLAVGPSIDGTSIEIAYAFIYHDTVAVRDIETKHGWLHSIVSFNTRTKKLEKFLVGHLGSRFFVSGKTSRFEHLMQPEIIPFVRENKTHINEWYREALEKHGIRL